jgi:rSAM/selenodomain-associated transferase 2
LKISIIIPVYHEAGRINALLAGLRSGRAGDPFEIIVVDGSPSIDTLRAITDPDVRQVASSRGRAAQMNAGASMAGGAVLLFLHADTLLPHGALPDIAAQISSGCDAGAFELQLDSKHPFLRFVSFTASLRSKLFKMPFGDQALFVTAAVFRAAGGFTDLPLMEDIDLMKRLKKKGCRIGIIPRPVISSARKWEAGGVYRNTVKNHVVRLRYRCGAAPAALAKLYYGEQ